MPEDNISTPTPINADPAPEQKGGGGFLKGKAPIFLAIGGTVVLAGIAVFTAVRLYQLRQQGVTPTAPEQPQAQVPTSTPSPTPTPVSSLTLTPTGSLTPTVTPRLSPTASVSATPTKKPTATPTGTSLPDAGVSLPTIVGVSMGLLLLTISVLLAL